MGRASKYVGPTTPPPGVAGAAAHPGPAFSPSTVGTEASQQQQRRRQHPRSKGCCCCRRTRGSRQTSVAPVPFVAEELEGRWSSAQPRGGTAPAWCIDPCVTVAAGRWALNERSFTWDADTHTASSGSDSGVDARGDVDIAALKVMHGSNSNAIFWGSVDAPSGAVLFKWTRLPNASPVRLLPQFDEQAPSP
jgi:hypothetical protein